MTKTWCVALMVMVTLCGMSWAQTSTEPMVTSTPIPVPTATNAGNSEQIARAFLAHEVVSYNGWLNFLRVSVAGGSQWVSGNFSMRPDGWITELVIDGVQYIAPGVKPQPGLPPNIDGSATQYNINLNGVDSGGQFVVNGNFYTALLAPGDPITVVLRPNSEGRFIPFALPEGVNAGDLRLRLGDNGVWSYDLEHGGFNLWLDPAATIDYEIFDVVSGAIYDRGTISLDGNQGSDGESVISTTYEGVSALLLDESQSWDYLLNATFDNSVERDGAQVQAKVIMTRAFNQPLSISASGLASDGKVEVRAWAPIGEEMPLIATADAVYQGGGMGKGGGSFGYYYANLSTPVGYDRLVVTITGTLDPGVTFNFYLSRGGGGGLGKG